MAQVTHMPIEPLEALARARYARSGSDDWSDNTFAAQVGVSNRAVARWRAAGGRIPWTTADVAAISLGLHPVVIWPEEWGALDAGLLEGTDRKALKGVQDALDAIGDRLAEEAAARQAECESLLALHRNDGATLMALEESTT